MQGLSLSQFGGLCSHPYCYVAAPAASVPALPTCSSTSALDRNHSLLRPQPRLRFSPYLIPTSVTSTKSMLADRLPSGCNTLSELSKSRSRESSPVSDSHSHKPRAKSRTTSLKKTQLMVPWQNCETPIIWWEDFIEHFLSEGISYVDIHLASEWVHVVNKSLSLQCTGLFNTDLVTCRSKVTSAFVSTLG